MNFLEAVMGQPAVYRLWMAPFAEQKFAPISAHNDLGQARRVLDVGCGPGTNAGHFAQSDYLGIDWNERYIRSAQRRHKGRFLVADAEKLTVLPGERFDFILANSLLHHIDIPPTKRLLAHLSSLLTEDGHVHIVELVLPSRASVPRCLALADRGKFPRPQEEWRQIFSDVFKPVVFEPFCVTAGDITVVMDGDLQDPPEAIPLLLEKFQLGYDVVYAQRVGRKESWWLRICYYLFYRLITILSGFQLPLDSGDFGLMSRRVVDELRRMPENDRYLRGMRSWVGFRQTGLPLERAERQGGESKYSFIKLLTLAADGIFSFSIVPLRLAAVLGAAAVFFSSAFSIWALYAKFLLHESPRGFTSLILAITFLAGVQLFFMGVIGEYVGRLYEASKGRPHYIVSQQFGRGSAGHFAGTDRHTTAPVEYSSKSQATY